MRWSGSKGGATSVLCTDLFPIQTTLVGSTVSYDPAKMTGQDILCACRRSLSFDPAPLADSVEQLGV